MLNSNITNEIWKDVLDFEGHYQISCQGNLRSIRSSQGNYRERLKKTSLDRNGYEIANLWKQNKPSTHLVHRLVAKVFLPNPENKATVNHKDGVKNNNILTNLEWCTQSENLQHAFDTGLSCREKCKKRQLGTKSKNAKSDYHNVSYDNARSKWIASVKLNRKSVGQKRFDTEIDAAKYVNHILDTHNIIDRPRNII